MSRYTAIERLRSGGASIEPGPEEPTDEPTEEPTQRTDGTEATAVGQHAWKRRCLAVAVGMLLVVGMLVAVLGDSRPRLAATNSKVAASRVAIPVLPGEQRCQGGEFVPRESAKIRLYPGFPRGGPGQPLVVSILDDLGRLVGQANVQGGYPAGRLDVAIPRPPRDLAPASFCLHNTGQQPVTFAGNLTAASPEALPGPNGPGARQTDEVRVDYFREGRESWLQLAPEIAQRFALFKPFFFGPWLMWATLAVVVGVFAFVIALLVTRIGERPRRARSDRPSRDAGRSRNRLLAAADRLRRSLPAMGWACAAIAFVNAAVWATVTPPLHVPDEPAHVGYVQYIADRWSLPPSGGPGSTDRSRERASRTGDDLSGEYQAVYFHLPFGAEAKPSWSERQDRELRDQLRQRPSRSALSGARGATSYPPLYYALEAVPARLTYGLDALGRLYLMRLTSALMGAVTVAFVYLFLRETFPSTPWLCAVGALAIAFQPVFSFMSGGVNNDNLVYTAGAVLIFLLARALRRGLTPRVGLGIGAAISVGLLAKPSMMTLVPGAGVGVALALWRSQDKRRAVVAALGAVATAVVVWTGWVTVNDAVFHRSTYLTGGLSSDATSRVTSLRGQASYLWQYFLPRLPFMAEQFPGYPSYPVWDVYIQGFVGRFGYFQYGFPMWANKVGLGILGAVATLAAVALARARRLVKARWAELVCYGALLGGALVLNATIGYRSRALTGFNFEQPRYLFPLLALYGAAVALASWAPGRRWGPAFGAFLVVLAMGHWLFAVLLTIARYYA